MSINTLVNNPQIVAELKSILDIETGQKLFHTGVLNFTGKNTSDTSANVYYVFLSGTPSMSVATIFISQSNITVTTSNNASIYATIVLPVNVILDMTGPCSIYNLTTNTSHICQYHFDTNSILSFQFDVPNINTSPGDNIFTQGFTLSFPLNPY